MTYWRLSPPLRRLPVSSGLLAHAEVPSPSLDPVTSRFPLPQGPHRCRYLHPRSNALGKVDASRDTVSKPARSAYVLCMQFLQIHLHHILSHSHLVHASDADRVHVLLTRRSQEGQGKPDGQFQKSLHRALLPHPSS